MKHFRGLCGFLLAASLPAALGQVSPDINPAPSRQFGQLDLDQPSAGANLLEGRELNAPSGIAVDTSVNPPIIYVADTLNSRVLAWRGVDAASRGAKADKVIGQRDFVSSSPQGPSSNLRTGLSVPTGVAVDSQGNLYVLDAGNNRILRYPTPFQQTGDLLAVDLVIGQKTVTSGNQANQGENAPSAKTLAFNSGGLRRAGLTLDPQGNLWVTDAINNRVLRFPESELAPNTTEPEADIVLGQFSFTTRNPPAAPDNTQRSLGVLSEPGAIAVDSQGGVYVADDFYRVLYYPTQSTGAAATRVLGILPSDQPGSYPNNFTLGAVDGTRLVGTVPSCVFTSGMVVFVCDPAQNRVVRYGPSSSWPAATEEAPSPSQADVYGQQGFMNGGANRGQVRPSANTLREPAGGAVVNGQLWLVDTANNRVLAYPSSPDFRYTNASGVLGQLDFEFDTVNLLEGRELFLAASNIRGAGMAVDTSSEVPHLWIADRLNHRVLGFRDARQVGAGVGIELTQTADIVIGQESPRDSVVNYPQGDPLLPNDRGLYYPADVAVDPATGDLYVADSFNGRVLRFPAPFAQPEGTTHRANLVLGQASFNQNIPDASASTMAQPVGLALFNNGSLAVSDFSLHRVLIFRRQNGDFVNGQSADVVLGQLDFASSSASGALNGLNEPRGLAVDSGDRLYVADSRNGRLVVYSNTNVIQNGAPGFTIGGFSSPSGVAVSQTTGEVWLAAYGNNRVYRLPEFVRLQQENKPTAEIPANGPLAVTLDAFENVVIAEAINRVVFHFPSMFYRHAANFAATRPLSPGTIAQIARRGKNFEFEPASAGIPYPTSLSGVQVSVGGIPAPIFRVTESSVFFIVPWGAPTSGSAEYLVTQPETGEILGATRFPMAPASPGFFTDNQAGTGQVAATNGDGTRNGPTSPVDRRGVITFWLTGLGPVSNPPEDGHAPGAAVATTTKPQVIINGRIIDQSSIKYSGLSPEFPGLWQLNIQLTEEMNLLPSDGITVFLSMFDIFSNIIGTANINVDAQLTVQNGITTFATK